MNSSYREALSKWHGKPYYSLNAYLQDTYHEKIYKIALNAGLTCPNRDGKLDTRGCIFCSSGGSGDFAVPLSSPLHFQKSFEEGKAKLSRKHTGSRFIAYFQAYTNTYGPLPYLRSIYEAALREPSVAGISIATRPDCIPEEVVTLLVNLKEEFPDKFVWIELGLQTIHEETARFIRRGYSLEVYDRCVMTLRQAGIPVITHVILGLPSETREHVLETISHINSLGIWGIKLQLLHILKETDLASLYMQGDYVPLTKEAYLDLVIDCLEQLDPHIVVHRVTGDGPKDLLLAPLWSLNKRDVLNSLHREMKHRNTYQGKLYHVMT